jgi:subtilisin family serine protease
MKWRRTLDLGLALAAILGLLPTLSVAAPTGQTPASPKIDVQVLDEIAVSGQADFWVVLGGEVDLSDAYDMGWEARGWYVYHALADQAQKTQAGAIAYLEAQGLAYESFWINNSIYVRHGTGAAIQALAARAEVRRIRADNLLFLPELPPANPTAVSGAYDNWGLDWVHAPDVWAMGYDGTGIVVASIDTGVQYTHPQLDETYRGAIDGSHEYNWCDPADVCAGDSPCDNNNHGTHVMGIITGENDDPEPDPNQIGMAPGSTWIACKGCEGQTCSDWALAECAQWIAAPTEVTSGSCSTTGTPNPAKRPYIVNNSWGDVVSDPWYRAFVQSWQALGILATFSAGNANTCGSLGSPGDYPESFASANHRSDGVINPTYSSRGPSSFGQTPYCKPNIAAPGTNICSSVPWNLYSCGFTGTSMASPHSAGAVALLWQACPALTGQVDLTFQTLQNSAAPPPADLCGSTPGCADVGCNCTYGYGYLDAYAAVSSCTSDADAGHLDGYVREKDSGVPVVGALVGVALNPAGRRSANAIADDSGYYVIALPAGTYTVTASYPDYLSSTATDVPIAPDADTTLNFTLTRLSPYVVSGHVLGAESDSPLAAQIEIVNSALPPFDTDPTTGFYTVPLSFGTYTFQVSSSGYLTAEQHLLVDRDLVQDFSLLPWQRIYFPIVGR